jgi:beta-lactamase class A
MGITGGNSKWRMTLKKWIWLTLIFLPATILSQKTDKKLESKIQEVFKGFHGEVGIYVKNLKTSKIAAVAADSLFPTASMIKVSLLIAVMDKIEKGELDYHGELIYKDSLLYEGVDILGSFKSGEKIELSKLMTLMMSMSDNTASLWLQSLAGGGIRVNQLLDSLGFRQTRVNSRTTGREGNRDLYGWGQTTPAEMVGLFEKIYKGEVVSKKASERMLRLMSRNYWDEAGISQVPPFVFVACKNGAVDASRSETMLVMAPQGPYIYSIITKNQQDTTWNPNNEGWELSRKISSLLWNYFEPGSDWKPSLSIEGKLN